MIHYRLATYDNLEQIAQVHITCFPNTMWEFLGADLVRRFYEEYLRENPLFVVASDGTQIIGLCMGYRRPSQARTRFMQKNKHRLIRRILFGLMTLNTLVIRKCWQNIRPQKQCKPIQAEGDLLSICVVDAYKGKGVAQELIRHFEEELTIQHIADYTLSVYTSNHRAITFYQHQGLQIIHEDGIQAVLYKRL